MPVDFFKNENISDKKNKLNSLYYNEVLSRIVEERKCNNKTSQDMAKLLSVANSTYYDMERGDYAIGNHYLKLMQDRGFDLYYVFTGERIGQIENSYYISKLDKDEIEWILLNLYLFVKKFHKKNDCLKEIYEEKKAQIFYVLNKDNESNIYETYRKYNNISQEDMAAKCFYSLNKYKNIKKKADITPNSKEVFAHYINFNLSPLIFIDEEKAYEREVIWLLDHFDKETKNYLSRYNYTLYLSLLGGHQDEQSKMYDNIRNFKN